MENNFNKLINFKRMRNSSLKRERKIDEIYSDRSRIIYSSSFRRLQQKAQVFSLEPNASVRTRLTHSLEVSDLGRTLANQIGHKLNNKDKITKNNISSLVAIVENACLLHDIGNPPFGHFGEAAIREWAKNMMETSVPNSLMNIEDKKYYIKLQNLINDFKEFDGNPQGFRIVTKLHTEHDKHSLNLTYSTLLCMIKYPRTTNEEYKGIFKKAGYFQTEKNIVEKLYADISLNANYRYPFVYIMEAADDIAYCMSDIADGIEKRILTEEKFLDEFKKEWEKNYPEETIPFDIPQSSQLKGFNIDISIPWSKKAINEAVEKFIENEEKILNGEAKSLISVENPMGKVLETMKNVSRRILYTSFEAEGIEITGYAVIKGILNKYSSVLKMEYNDFIKLINMDALKGYDYEKRLFHQIGKRYVKAYEYEIKEIDNLKNEKEMDFLIKEWWLRAHLIIDHISGMTDDFALETYQMLEGIKLMR